jgi:tetratricopeptide (TPR) repeat protein
MNEQFEQQCDKALSLYSLSRFEMALSEVHGALLVDPENAWLLTLAAKCLNRLDRSEEAEESARLALELAPGFLHAHQALLEALRYQNKLGQPIVDCVQRMLEECPHEATAYAAASSVYLDLDWKDETLEATRVGLEIQPDHLHCLYNRSEALFGLFRFREAKDCLRRLLDSDPENIPAINRLGWEEYKAGNLKDADELFLKALELRPESESALKGIKLVRNLLPACD